MSKVATEITGEVREHHFRCSNNHEFSVLTKAGLEVSPSLSGCIADGCQGWSYEIGDNVAEVSKNPTDLLKH